MLTTRYAALVGRYVVIDATTGQDIETLPSFYTLAEARDACGSRWTDDATHLYDIDA